MPSSTEKAFNFSEAFEIEGVHTEFVAQKFANKTLLIVTQFQKISNFYSVQNHIFNDDNAMGTRNTEVFDIKQRFGSQSIEVEGAIRYLLNFLDTTKEILICLSLKNQEEIEKSQLDEIKEVLINIPGLAK